MRAIDVHGFGGGMTLGVVQAGWELEAKMSRSAGFGVYNTLANRHLLGEGWDSHAGEPERWERRDAELVFGNPPCSGFSTLSPKAFRGQDSKINDYMWELIEYAGRVAPATVAWESVQTTFRQGLPLMRRLHQRLQEVSGHRYHLTHVLHNNLSHGGVSMRKRYFWVASRAPFGVELGRATRDGGYAGLDHVPTFGDMLRDLAPLGLTMAPQAYPNAVWSRDVYGEETGEVVLPTASTWSRREAHDGTGVVDGQDVYHSNTINRTHDLLEAGEEWATGEVISDVLKRVYERDGRLPQAWRYTTKKVDPDGKTVVLTKEERLVETGFAMGHNQPARWSANRPANVITGGAVHLVVHPWLPRLITHREAARIQGFPDDWHIWAVRHAPDVGPGWGKGVPVQSARWVGHWLRRSLEGSPGSMSGVPLEAYNKRLYGLHGAYDDETVVDTTYAFRSLQQEAPAGAGALLPA